MEIKFEKYRQNLTQVGNNIYSYDTRVATITLTLKNRNHEHTRQRNGSTNFI